MAVISFDDIKEEKKSYIECLREISSDELYDGLLGYGMFAEKLPPIFTSEAFLKYCKSRPISFHQIEHDYISVNITRNNNKIRVMGIPNPMAYHFMCEFLSEKWDDIIEYFDATTSYQSDKISRVHIRKCKDRKSLFKMNYDSWKVDGEPHIDWRIGKNYVVKADISNCFPSIYTHALTWAIDGKETAKIESNMKIEKWSKDIDDFAMNLKNRETHGLLIGPHASNLISEIILTKVDQRLNQSNNNWKYTRHVDDYTCYVNSNDEAKLFLLELQRNLHEYDLTLNNNKSIIEKLPVNEAEDRFNIIKRDISTVLINRNSQTIKCKDGKEYIKLNYNEVKNYLDLSISLSEREPLDIAVVTYAIKVLSNKEKYILSRNAKIYLYKTCLYLVGIYPYLWQVVYENVFDEINETNIKKRLSESALCNAIKSGNLESAYYAICSAIKYNYDIDLDMTWVMDSNDCLLYLLSWLYAKKKKDKEFKERLKNKALQLSLTVTEMERNWIFVYECLSKDELRNVGACSSDWCSLKKYGVSFIRKEYKK